MKNEKVSGSSLPTGALVVASNWNEMIDPSPNPCKLSLKKLVPPTVLSVTLPGSEPVTDPLFGPATPRVPSVEKSEKVRLLFCVPPPATKSKASVAPVPVRLEVLIVTS